MHPNAINWFEVPVTDMARACKFYGTILDAEIAPDPNMGEMSYAFFPVEMTPNSVGGALSKSDGFMPSQTGTMIYLNANPDLQVVLDRVEAAGGTVVGPKMNIGEYGNIAFIVDTEGNKVGLHSMG